MNIDKQDLVHIYNALLYLAHGEGSAVAEALCAAAGGDGMRIYNEVFSDENMTVER